MSCSLNPQECSVCLFEQEEEVKLNNIFLWQLDVAVHTLTLILSRSQLISHERNSPVIISDRQLFRAIVIYNLRSLFQNFDRYLKTDDRYL